MTFTPKNENRFLIEWNERLSEKSDKVKEEWGAIKTSLNTSKNISELQIFQAKLFLNENDLIID